MSAAPQPLTRDPLAVCACLSPLCTDAEHAAGKCARCVKREALYAKRLCACGAKLVVTTEVASGWCVPCQSIPLGHRLSTAFESATDLVKQLEAEREERAAREYHDDCMHDAEERAHAGECDPVNTLGGSL